MGGGTDDEVEVLKTFLKGVRDQDKRKGVQERSEFSEFPIRQVGEEVEGSEFWEIS